MKKKVIISVSLLGIFSIINFLNIDFDINTKNDLILQNIEAYAAATEGGTTHECYDSYSTSGRKGTIRHERVCDGCTYLDIFKPKNNTICTE